jgi:hypothetical protein
MPRTRLKAWVLAPDQAALNALKGVVNAVVPPPGKIFDKPRDWTVSEDEDTGELRVVFDFRFKAKVDGDAFYDDLVALNASMAATGCSGAYSVHDCSHDDPVVLDCREDPASSWREDGF